MATYSRTIGRQLSNTFPAWRMAMTDTNTLYRLTTRNHFTDLSPKISWPGGVRPTKFGNDFDAVTLHAAYGGCVYVPDAGPFGTHVYMATGEDTFFDQMTCLPLHEDNPEWDMWQQPDFALTEVEAAARDSEWYYNPTEAAALEASQPWPNNRELPTDWNQTFTPKLTNMGWILWKKAKLTLGNNRSHAMRYNMPCYIPPSMTGTGDGAIITNDDAFAGPYSGNNGKPGNVGDPGQETLFPSSSYCSDMWPNGNQKVFCRAMNTRTKVWTRLEDTAFDPLKGSDITRNASFVDENNKRVYYRTADRIYYLDFSNGIAEATTSARTTCQINDPANVRGGGDFSYNAAHCPTEGHPEGRRLMYFLNSTGSSDPSHKNALYVVDIDNAQIYVLDMYSRGLDFGGLDYVGMGYDPAQNRVFMTYQNVTNTAIKCSSFEVPSNPTLASNYTVDTVTLAMGPSATLDSTPYRLHFGHHCKFITQLGVIIYQQQNDSPLVFRPY